MMNNETQQLLPGVVKPDAGLRGPLRSWFPKTAAALEQPTGQLADATGTAGATVTQPSSPGIIGTAHSMAGEIYDKMGIGADTRNSIYNTVAGPSGLGAMLFGKPRGNGIDLGKDAGSDTAWGNPAATAPAQAPGAALTLSGGDKPKVAPALTRREDQAQIKPGTPVKAAPVAGFTPAARQAVNMPVLNQNAGGLFSAMAGFQGDAAAAGSAIANNRMAKTMDEIGLRNAGRIDSYNQQNASRGEQGRQFGLGLQQKDRQFDIGTGEHRFQYDTTLGENKRQFDANLGLHQQQNQIAMAKAMMEQGRANEDHMDKIIDRASTVMGGKDGKTPVVDPTLRNTLAEQLNAQHPGLSTAAPATRNAVLNQAINQSRATTATQSDDLTLLGKMAPSWAVEAPSAPMAHIPTLSQKGAGLKDWFTNKNVGMFGDNYKTNTGHWININNGKVNGQAVTPEIADVLQKQAQAGKVKDIGMRQVFEKP